MKEIYEFLKLKGFHLLKSNKTNSFGNYYDIFANDIFAIRFIRDKSITTIDVQSVFGDKKLWYDLALVKNLMQGETQLNYVMTIEQYIDFLKNYIDNIGALFDRDNYLLTENELEKLKNERTKQMFPWIK